MNYGTNALKIAALVFVITALVDYLVIKTKGRGLSYGRLAFIMGIVYGIWGFLTMYTPWSTSLLFWGAPLVAFCSWIWEKITRRVVTFQLYSRIFGGILIAGAFFFFLYPGGQMAMVNLFIYGLLWLLLFGFNVGGNLASNFLPKDKVAVENRNKRQKTSKISDDGKKKETLHLGSPSMITLISVIASACLGLIIYFATKGYTPKVSTQYIYWTLGGLTAILSIIFLTLKRPNDLGKIGVALSCFALMFLILGANCSSQVAKANHKFDEASKAFNVSYKLMKTGKEIDEDNEDIENNPLVQEAEEDGYVDSSDYEDEDDDELNEDIIRDMKKDLKEMKRNNTGKYSISRYEDKLEDIEDDYYDDY